MPPFLSRVLSFLMCISLFSAMASDVQSQASSSTVVLEATSTMHGVGGYQHEELLVRLTDDGKVEWDKEVGNEWERQTSTVSAEVVSEIQRTLNTVDEDPFRGKMGPYYVYIDTSVELQVRMTAKSGQVTFLLINPWSVGIVRRTMPKDVKTVVCEIDTLNARVSNNPVHQMCKASNKSP